MEQEVNILKKLLNNSLFLSDFPLIKYVHVKQYGKENIDVVFTFNDGFEFSDYKGIREKARESVYQLAKYASISPRYISVYP